MSKHTPGPWAYYKCTCGHPACKQFFIGHQGSVGFIEDDARLICAGPEMLAVLTDGPSLALPEFLEWVADRLVHVHREPDGIDFVLSLRERARLARAAIAKAEGIAP